MEIAFSECVPITDTSSVGEARRRGLLTAERLGFDDVRSGEVALLATEVSRNVLLHGGGGQAIFTGCKTSQRSVAGILALDNGPGISNVTQALGDGFSTGGTLGVGFGAMQRIASSLEVFTAPNGTIVFMEVADGEPRSHLQIGGFAIPYPGERVCGDAWICHQTAERSLILLVDGLGHGCHAADAANEAVEVFKKRSNHSPREVISYIHDALKKTRGAAAAVVEIRPGDGILTYVGVGNTSAIVMSKELSRSLVSHNGTLGTGTPKIQEFRVEWPADGILIMHTDGLLSRWDLSPYAGLLARHPAVIAGALFRDFRRQRDDSSVVVVKAIS